VLLLFLLWQLQLVCIFHEGSVVGEIVRVYQFLLLGGRIDDHVNSQIGLFLSEFFLLLFFSGSQLYILLA
jgi:hypothetical protein